MINLEIIAENSAIKLAKYYANKEKRIKDIWFLKDLTREAKNSIKFSNHAANRIAQRFEESDVENLCLAISRAIRSFKVEGNYHIKKSIKYYDEATNFVIVLERFGKMGANIITAWVDGKDNLLSLSELNLIQKKGFSIWLLMS